MSSFSYTAEQLLELFDRVRAHPDKRVDRIILKTDIENALNCEMQHLYREIAHLKNYRF